MPTIAYPKSPLRGLHKRFLVLLILSVVLSAVPVLPAQASTNYIDTFSSAPFTGYVSEFLTGSPTTGLSYTCTNCLFQYETGEIRASQLLGPLGSSVTITDRDGDDFDFNSIRVTSSYPIIIIGYGPEPFEINLPFGPVTPVGPTSPSQVTRVEIIPAFGASHFNLIFDDVNVNLFDPEIQIERPAGTIIPDGGTDDLGVVPIGTTMLGYEHSNLGDSELITSSVTASNLNNVSNFKVVGLHTHLMGYTSFLVYFDINAPGAFSFDMDIASNDADENPYDIHVQGVGDPPPEITSITRQTPATSPTDADSLVFRVTFSENVLNVDSADFTVTGTTASITNLNTVSAAVYDITVSGGNLADLDGIVGLDLYGVQNITDLLDQALPTAEPSIDETYLVDNNDPYIIGILRQTPAERLTSADVLVFKIIFSEAAQNIDPSDFAVSGTSATVTGINQVSTQVYELTVSGGDLAGLNGSVLLDLSVGQNITDLAGKALSGIGPREDYLLDNGAPGITSFTRQTPAFSPTNADTLIFRATFDENVQNVDVADFVVTGTTATVSHVNLINASSCDLTVSGGDLAGLNGSVGMDLAGSQNIYDLAGNALPAGEPGIDQSYLVDNQVPEIISFTRQTPDTSPTNAVTLIFRAIFTEDVQNIDPTDFSVTGTTAPVTSISAVTASTYDLTVSGGNLAGLNGPVGLDLAGSQNIYDQAGNSLPAGEPATDETYLVDNNSPSPVIDQASGQTDPAFTLPIHFRVDFGEAVTGFDAADLSFGGTAPGTPAAVVTGGPQIYNAAVSGLTGDGTLSIDFSAGAAQDAVGNPSAAPILADNQVSFDGDPEIDLQRPTATSILDGGTDSLGNRPLGQVSLTYTIDNSAGTDVLNVNSVTASNLINASGLSLDTATPITVPGGQVATFDLSFDVEVNGPFSLDLGLANNDSDEDPYDLTLSGTGTGGEPEIEVERPAGTAIISGGSDAIGAPGVGTVNLTYRLDNSAGTSQLDVTSVTATNLNNVSFVVFSPGTPISVPAGTTGSVDVSFDVLAEGDFSFSLAISSNDSDEGSYAFLVSGTALDLQVLMSGGTSPLDGAVLYEGPSILTVQFNKAVQSGGGSGAADNPANYLLVEAGPDGEHDTTACVLGIGDDDLSIPISSVSYDPTARTAALGIGGAPLPNGRYRLLICGTTSVRDLFDVKLNGGLSDTLISFLVTDRPSLPDTGFPPSRYTALPAQPLGKQYHSLGELWLEIPSLGVQQAIIGVPQTSEGWDVTWLGERIGYLAGTTFPTWSGNTGLTGHVYDANGLPGPFEKLNQLRWGERVLIHAFGQVYTYEVRSVQNWVRPADSRSLIRHEDYDWITLITCRGYDPASGGYTYRSVVRAVLVKIEAE